MLAIALCGGGGGVCNVTTGQGIWVDTCRSTDLHVFAFGLTAKLALKA
jgi:hypothetical protein